MAKSSRTIEFGNIWEDGSTPSASHERWGNHWMAWSFWAFTLEDAARIIGEQAFHNETKKGHVVMPSVLAVRAMLLGYAIECAMKCYWLKRGKVVKNGKFRRGRRTQPHSTLEDRWNQGISAPSQNHGPVCAGSHAVLPVRVPKPSDAGPPDTGPASRPIRSLPGRCLALPTAWPSHVGSVCS